MQTYSYYKVMNPDTQYFIVKSQEGCVFIGSNNAPLEEVHTYVKGIASLIEGVKEDFIELENTVTNILQGKPYDLPRLEYQGSALQHEVWEYLQTIPCGETRSYRDVASALGKPKAVRAIASAIGKNPLLYVVPCHRVIGSDGSLRGYRGGLEVKKHLLAVEKQDI